MVEIAVWIAAVLFLCFVAAVTIVGAISWIDDAMKEAEREALRTKRDENEVDVLMGRPERHK